MYIVVPAGIGNGEVTALSMSYFATDSRRYFWLVCLFCVNIPKLQNGLRERERDVYY
jgi:hypothetical protein